MAQTLRWWEPVIGRSPVGICFSAPDPELGIIPWEYIAAVRTGTPFGARKGKYLQIELRDWDRYQKTLQEPAAQQLCGYVAYLKKYASALAELTELVICLPTSLLPAPAEEIAARMAAYPVLRGG